MVYLRKADYSDLELLYNWANDPLVRQNSFKSEEIPLKEHIMWFNRMMEDDSVHQFILMIDDKPVGQIRLKTEEGAAEIGYSIALEYRKKGLGRMLLKLIKDEVKKEFPEVKTLIAKVKPGNRASKNIFESEQFDLKYLCYSLEMN